jgi:HEAT repeat protein
MGASPRSAQLTVCLVACLIVSVIVSLIVLVSCPFRSQTPAEDSGPAEGAPQPEQRFENDPELVADFANLKSCTTHQGRLDRSCPQLRTLENRIRVKRRRSENLDKLVATLTNLLESRQELTRLVAADSLYPFLQQPRTVTALNSALQVERVASIRAAILRQLCWKGSREVFNKALAHLAPSAPEPVRAEAATCLGRQDPMTEASIRALKKSLSRDPSARVRSNACAALGSPAAAAAVNVVTEHLGDKQVAWRCVTALAAMGTKPAYAALKQLVSQSIDKGHIISQSIGALASFHDKPFFEKAQVTALLSRITADEKLGQVAVQRAVQRATRELERLGRQDRP